MYFYLMSTIGKLDKCKLSWWKDLPITFQRLLIVVLAALNV